MRYQRVFRRGATLVMASVLLALAPGCASTRIQSTIHPAGAGVAPFRNVTVVGVDQRPEVRDPFENDAVTLLREHGVEGPPSHSFLTFDVIQGDKHQLHQRLLAAGAESVLYLRVTSRTDFVDGPPVTLGD